MQYVPIVPLHNIIRYSFIRLHFDQQWSYFIVETCQLSLPYFQLGNRGSNLTEEELETHTISAWKEGKPYLNRQINGHGTAFSRHLIHVSVLYALVCHNVHVFY